MEECGGEELEEEEWRRRRRRLELEKVEEDVEDVGVEEEGGDKGKG
jgi:hypothetical protein